MQLKKKRTETKHCNIHSCWVKFKIIKARENSKGFQRENCYHLESNKDLLHDSLLHSLWEPAGNGVLCKALKESKFKSRILYQHCYVLNFIFPQKLFDQKKFWFFLTFNFAFISEVA